MTSCPECGKSYFFPERALGRNVRCSACQAVFTLTGQGAPGPRPSVRKPSASRSAAQEEVQVRSGGNAQASPRQGSPTFPEGPYPSNPSLALEEPSSGNSTFLVLMVVNFVLLLGSMGVLGYFFLFSPDQSGPPDPEVVAPAEKGGIDRKLE